MRTYKPDTIDDPEIVAYSKKLSLLNIIGIITAHIDKVLIFTWLGSVELAIYGIAVSFPEQIKTLLRNLNNLMIPKFAQKVMGAESLQLKRKISQLALVLTLITAAYITAAPFLYDIFFPTYPESVRYSQIFAISLLATLAMVPTSVLISQKKDEELSRISVWSSIFQIAILLPFVHYWGIMGVVLAKVLTAYLNMTISFIMVRKNYTL